MTAFPSRRVFRRFVEEIAWGTQVWIASEAEHVIRFGSQRSSREDAPGVVSTSGRQSPHRFQTRQTRLDTAYRDWPCHTGRATSRAQYPDAVLAFQERGDRVYKAGGILIHGHMATAWHNLPWLPQCAVEIPAHKWVARDRLIDPTAATLELRSDAGAF